jgi:hypothetical protein
VDLFEGNIMLGLSSAYWFNDQWNVSLSLWLHNNQVKYLESALYKPDQFVFLHEEKQGWLNVPVIVKWTSPALRWLERVDDLNAQIFFQGGASLNYLAFSRANIIDSANDLFFRELNVTDTRHRFNYDLIGGLGSRFQLGRSFLSIGFCGTLGLKDVLKQDLVKSLENPLYRDYGIVENNYKTNSLFYFITWEWRLNYLSRKGRERR